MTTSTNTLPTVSANNKPLWAAVGFLGIAVLALGAGLVYVQNRPADGTTALLATAPKTETEMAWSSRQDDLVAPPPPAVATVQPAPAKPVKPALVAASPSVLRPKVNKAIITTLDTPRSRCSRQRKRRLKTAPTSRRHTMYRHTSGIATRPRMAVTCDGE